MTPAIPTTMIYFTKMSIVLLTTTLTFLLLVPDVNGMTANPARKYAALSKRTNDGGTDTNNPHYRKIDEVYARFASADDADPTEETLEGYTIIYNREMKRYEYATLNTSTGDIEASGEPVVKGLKPSRDKIPDKHVRRTSLESIAMTPVTFSGVSGSSAGLMAAMTEQSSESYIESDLEVMMQPSVSSTNYYNSNATYYYGNEEDSFTEERYYFENATLEDDFYNYDDDANVMPVSRRVLKDTPGALGTNKKKGDESSFDGEVPQHRHRSLQHVVPEGASNAKCLVVPIRFKNHNDRQDKLLKQHEINDLFNYDGVHEDYAPTGSMKTVFEHLSHKHLSFEATVMDWIEVSENEQYYSGGIRGYDVTKMHQALTEALNYLETTVKFDFRPFDSNSDGILDCVMFMHSGYAAEFGGVSEDGAYFMDRIWSHTGNLGNSLQDGWLSTTQNKRVTEYAITSINHGTHPNMDGADLRDKIVRVGVIAHELAKVLGLVTPFSESQKFGSWTLASGQSNLWGFSADQYCVPPLDPLTKQRKKWFPSSSGEAKEITTDPSGKIITIGPSFTLENAEDTAIIIQSGFPVKKEYLMLEYRKRGPSPLEDGCIPNTPRYSNADTDGGLLVWHIDESPYGERSDSTALGIVAADGDDDKLITNLGNTGDLFHPMLLDSLGPSAYNNEQTLDGQTLFPSTDSYRSAYAFTGISLKDISFNNDGKLNVRVEWLVDPTTTLSPVAPPLPAPTETPTLAPIGPTMSPAVGPTTLSPSRYTAAPFSNELYDNTASPLDKCSSSDDALFMMELITDLKGHETTWMLVDSQRGNSLKQKGGPYEKGVSKVFRYSKCLAKKTCWVWTIEDSGGNGIDRRGSPKGAGYKVWWDGEMISQTLPTALGQSPTFVETGISFGSDCSQKKQGTDDSKTVSLGSPDRNSPENYDENLVLGQGIMFDIHLHSQFGQNAFRNSGKSIIFKRLQALHVTHPPGPMAADAPINIRVYTRRGTYQGYELSEQGWDLALKRDARLVDKQGLFSLTYLSHITEGGGTLDNDKQPVLRSGSTQAFYIVTDPPVLAMLNCSKDMQVSNNPSQLWGTGQDNKHFSALSGVPMKSNFHGMDDDESVNTVCMDADIQYDIQEIGDAVSDDVNVGCPAEKEEFTLDITIPKDRASDIEWSIEDIVAKKFQMKSPVYDGSETNYHHSVCVPVNNDSCYKFIIRDKTGKGIDHKAKYGSNFLVHERNSSFNPFEFQESGGEFGGSACQSVNHDVPKENFRFDLRGEPKDDVKGIMFDIRENDLEQDVIIFKMAAFILKALDDGIKHHVRMWTKNGSFKGYESNDKAWIPVLNKQIPGTGKISWQQNLGSFTHNVVISQHTTHAFYLVVDKVLWTKDMSGKKPGEFYRSSIKGLNALVGVGCNSATAFQGCDEFNNPNRPSVGLLGVLLEGVLTVKDDATYSPTQSPIIPISPTQYPTYNWEPSPAPTRYIRDIFCGAQPGSKALRITLDTTGSNAPDLSWVLEDVANKYPLVENKISPNYVQGSPQTHQYCLPHDDACYRFVLSDSTMQGAYHRVTYDGEVISEYKEGQTAPTQYRPSGVDFGGGCQRYDENQGVNLALGLSEGGPRSDGIMFDVVAGSKETNAINIAQLASIHLTGGMHHIQIYTKNGSYQGYETSPESWTLVFDNDNIRGSGRDRLTSINNNELLEKVTIAPETIQGFYILETLNDGGMFYYSRPAEEVGKTFKEVEGHQVLTGVACSGTIAFASASCGSKSDGAGFSGELVAYKLPIRDNDVSQPTPVVTPAPSPVAVPLSAAPVPHPVIEPVPVPVPEPEPVPTPTGDGGTCQTNEGILDISITAESIEHASKLSWIVDDVVSASYRETSPLDAPYSTPTIRQQLCIPENANACYRFVLYDDSESATSGTIHTVKYNGKIVSEVKSGTGTPYFSSMGGNFSSNDSVCKRIPAEGKNPYPIARQATDRASGIMFDVQSLEDVHTNIYRMHGFRLLEGGTYNINIYTKMGTYKGYESSKGDWELIKTLKGVEGKGQNAWSIKQETFETNVPILAGTTQAFYVLVQGGIGDTANPMLCSRDDNVGQIYGTTDKFHVKIGTTCSSPKEFENCNAEGAKFEGVLMAGFVEVQSTFSPTPAPTSTTVTVPTPALIPTTAPSIPTCDDDEENFAITLKAHDQAHMIRWVVKDIVNGDQVVARSDAYPELSYIKEYKSTTCLPKNGCYQLALRDDSHRGFEHLATFGSGYNGDDNYYEIASEKMEGQVFSSEVVDFGERCTNLASDNRMYFDFPTSGKDVTNGIMFDMRSDDKFLDVIIFRLASLVLTKGTHMIEVYTKNGSYQGFEDLKGSWTKVLEKSVTNDNAGPANTSVRANFIKFVPIVARSHQAFYIVDKSGLGFHVDTESSNVRNAGDLWKVIEAKKLNVFTGTTCTSAVPFESCTDGLPAGFNGRILLGDIDEQYRIEVQK